MSTAAPLPPGPPPGIDPANLIARPSRAVPAVPWESQNANLRHVGIARIGVGGLALAPEIVVAFDASELVAQVLRDVAAAYAADSDDLTGRLEDLATAMTDVGNGGERYLHLGYSKRAAEDTAAERLDDAIADFETVTEIRNCTLGVTLHHDLAGELADRLITAMIAAKRAEEAGRERVAPLLRSVAP